MENSALKSAPSKNGKSPETSQHERVVELLSEFYAVVGNAPETVGALNAMAYDLMNTERATYDQIRIALGECKRCKFPVRLPHIIEQLELLDGRPEPEAAWAMCPKSEEQSVVWTEEIAKAFGASSGLDDVSGRMAFKEAYVSAVKEARRAHRPIKWMVSLGYDKADRVRAVAQAVTEGKMLSDHALELVGDRREELLMALPTAVTKALPGEVRKISRLTGLHRAVAEFAAEKGMGLEPDRFPNGNPRLNIALVQARALAGKERQ